MALRLSPTAPVLATLVALSVTGCATSGSPPTRAPLVATTTSGAVTADPLAGTITVLAASSLTEALGAVARDIEQDHPGLEIRLSFGSSTTLAQQLAAGAPADLAIFAGTTALEHLDTSLTAPGRVTTVARNVMELATPPGNPAGVTGLKSLAEVDTVLCVATAPCGIAADTLLARAGVDAHVVSRELDVKSTLAKIRLDEADAAIVYHSDIVTAGAAVTGVPIPNAQNTTIDYPLLTVTDTPAARAVAAYLTGAEGQARLAAAGFLPPP